MAAAGGMVPAVMPLRTQAVATLRQAIIDGRLGPGTRLVERGLGEMLGVSRTLVREALRQLEAEGWVSNADSKGPAVTVLTAESARQLYEVRRALEGLAAERAAALASPAQVAQLRESLDAMREHVAAGDMLAHQAEIEVFYAILLRAGGNPLLAELIAAQRGQLAQLRRLSLAQPARALASIADKQRLVDAIARGDGAAARQISEAHIRDSAAAAAATLAGLAPPAPPAVTAPRRRGRPAIALPKI